MRPEADRISRWLECSDTPSVINCTEGNRKGSFVFKEISASGSGFLKTQHTRNHGELVISCALTSNLVRNNKKSSFVKTFEDPILYFPNEIEYSEWQGFAHSLCVVISQSFIEEILWSKIPEFPRQTAGTLSPRIKHILNVLRFDAEAGSPAGGTISEAAIVELVGLVSNTKGPSGEKTKLQGLGNRIKRICDLIDERLSSKITILELAQTADMSVRNFTRAFHLNTGCSPHQYVIERRLVRAQELIGTGTLTLAEVAERVGFASQAHMGATFRKRLGTTPSHFGNRAF